MSRRRPATRARRRPSADPRRGRVVAAVALLLQGLVGTGIGLRLVQQAGEIPDSALSGFAGVLGFGFLVPGAASLSAGVGLWRERPWGARLGRVISGLGIAVGALIALAGALTANPGLILLGLFLAGINWAVFAALRR